MQTITAKQIRDALVVDDAEFVRLVYVEDLQRAFRERSEALSRSADECITLTNERDALRDALRAVLNAAPIDAALIVAKARRVLQTVSMRESGFAETQPLAYTESQP
jgi:hypothetical protein